MRRFVAVTGAVVALLAGAATVSPLPAAAARPNPVVQAEPRSRVVYLPSSADAVHGCEIASAYPDGHPVCGYKQDGPWLFPSGRSVTCWAGIQYRGDNNYRYWAKCHAKGVHGTIVDAYYELRDATLTRWIGSPRAFDGKIATGCQPPNECGKTGKDVYWVGQWRPHPGSPYGIAITYHVWGHIQGTADETSEHCVPSKIWFLVYYDNASLDCL